MPLRPNAAQTCDTEPSTGEVCRPRIRTAASSWMPNGHVVALTCSLFKIQTCIQKGSHWNWKMSWTSCVPLVCNWSTSGTHGILCQNLCNGRPKPAKPGVDALLLGSPFASFYQDFAPGLPSSLRVSMLPLKTRHQPRFTSHMPTMGSKCRCCFFSVPLLSEQPHDCTRALVLQMCIPLFLSTHIYI